jgi:inorganic pyrophosphatase
MESCCGILITQLPFGAPARHLISVAEFAPATDGIGQLNTMNPWHDVEPGKRAPEIVDCIIEVPRGSRNKYELDKKTGLLRLDRVLYSAVFYPANYGFIPRTYCDDRDPLDILVLGQEPVVPMCIVTARPIGMMQMVDQNEEDDKIIAIHENDPAVSHFRDISQLPEHTLNELQRFFEDYKILEHKRVRIERFFGRVDAQNVIAKSLRLYTDSYDDEGRKRADAPLLQSELRDRNPAASPSRSVRIEHARREAQRLQHLDQPEPATPTPQYEPVATTGVEPAGAIAADGIPASMQKLEVAEAPSGAPEPLAESATRSAIAPITFDFHTLDAHAPRGQATNLSESTSDSRPAPSTSSSQAGIGAEAAETATRGAVAPELAGEAPGHHTNGNDSTGSGAPDLSTTMPDDQKA